ncbi:MAG: TorF family putative porin [Ferrovibrio sp.]|uniref:TorF family putative porin n=1 Tax=Ferrovibrio sp. TaxID=1917215 RepID=UPI0026255D82|nr:TorF family putative porin [Ferrovibrio sp.]MCW0232891.1 TorF family putative porin [Ferrovibrio sp.]
MTKVIFRAALVALGLVAAAPAIAADIPLSVAVNAGVVSDYKFRGISQSNNDPAVQGGVEAALAPNDWLSIYAGLWASSVDFNNGTDAEVDAYGGFRGTFDKLGLDLGFIRYIYTGQGGTSAENYTEFKAAASYDFGFVLPSAGIYYSPDFYNNSGRAVYYTAGVAVPIPVTDLSPVIKANIGKQTIDKPANFGITKDDYIDYNIGLFATYWGFTAGVQFVDTNLSKTECGGLKTCDSAAVFSLNYAYTF